VSGLPLSHCENAISRTRQSFFIPGEYFGWRKRTLMERHGSKASCDHFSGLKNPGRFSRCSV
jgi:hypothetical protein